ncbi:MauE/DoxX family redox-associated membrane protein [Micromonospora sp. NPDC049102]|uniref:MauE/DoxX family redox-associated membrane protein n=1 Tax=Micromonospora sp. NPDC049102 TaxID=3364265 RepID=UPI003713C29B
MHYVAVGAQCVIGVVFIASSVGKVAGRRAFPSFLASLDGTRLLPPSLVRPAALSVVAAEFGVWVLLAAHRQATVATGFALAAVLLTVFALGIALVLVRGLRTPCRCFGRSTSPLGLRHVVRNVGLAALALLGAATLRTGPVPPEGLAVAVCSGLMLGGLVAVLDDILDLFLPVNVSRTRTAASGSKKI